MKTINQIFESYEFSPLQLLNSNSWANDYGFRKATKNGSYYQREKSHKKLWDLLTYSGSSNAAEIIAYFDLPKDTYEFLIWVYNHVGYDYRKVPAQGNQMDCMPYKALYATWELQGKPNDGFDCVVLENRITDQKETVTYMVY